MDWPVTARTLTPHVRQTVADRELETWLVVDLSPSLDFGTVNTEKRELVFAAATAITPPDRQVRQPDRRDRHQRRADLPDPGGRRHEPRPLPDAQAGRARRADQRPRQRPGPGPGTGPPATAPARHGGGDLGLPRRARTGNVRCAVWATGTSCSASRSSTRASWTCRRPGWSPSSIRSPASRSRCRPRTRRCGRATPRPPGSSARTSPRCCAGPGPTTCGCAPTRTGCRTWCASSSPAAAASPSGRRRGPAMIGVH